MLNKAQHMCTRYVDPIEMLLEDCYSFLESYTKGIVFVITKHTIILHHIYTLHSDEYT